MRSSYESSVILALADHGVRRGDPSTIPSVQTDWSPPVSHDHHQTLRQIFSHPISMNIKWKEVVHLFESLGGRVEPAHGGRETVHLNGKQMTFHVPHGKTIDSKNEVMQIKKFLESAGVAPGG